MSLFSQEILNLGWKINFFNLAFDICCRDSSLWSCNKMPFQTEAGNILVHLWHTEGLCSPFHACLGQQQTWNQRLDTGLNFSQSWVCLGKVFGSVCCAKIQAGHESEFSQSSNAAVFRLLRPLLIWHVVTFTHTHRGSFKPSKSNPPTATNA